MLWARWFWLDLRMGKCSGFPSCCILFYSTAWRSIYGDTRTPLSKKSAWRQRLIRWYGGKNGGCEYLPCPLCIISGARVRVRKCTPECGHREECRRLIRERDNRP